MSGPRDQGRHDPQPAPNTGPPQPRARDEQRADHPTARNSGGKPAKNDPSLAPESGDRKATG